MQIGVKNATKMSKNGHDHFTILSHNFTLYAKMTGKVCINCPKLSRNCYTFYTYMHLVQKFMHYLGGICVGLSHLWYIWGGDRWGRIPPR